MLIHENSKTYNDRGLYLYMKLHEPSSLPETLAGLASKATPREGTCCVDHIGAEIEQRRWTQADFSSVGSFLRGLIIRGGMLL